jgi:hypothetical protein
VGESMKRSKVGAIWIILALAILTDCTPVNIENIRKEVKAKVRILFLLIAINHTYSLLP